MRKFWIATSAVALLCISALAVEQAALHYGAWGFDATGEDRSVKPGDDFFRFANGDWLDRTPIPADKTIFGLRALMTDLTEARLHVLMEAAASQAGHEPVSLEGKVGAFYKAFQDEARVERLGAEPLKPELDAIRMADTRDALAGLMGHGGEDFYGSLFDVSVQVDRKDPSRYSVYLAQAGLGLPDRDYYSNPTLASQKAQYQAYVASLLRLAAWPEPETRAREIVELETRIAEASWTKADRRDLDKVYNPITVAELQTFAPGFAWQAYLGSAGLGNVSQVVVREKSAFPKLAAVYASTPIEVLKAWAAFNVADHAAPYLSSPFTQAYFQMREKTLSGMQEQQVRWKRAVHAVSGGDYGAGDRFDRFGNLGWGVGQLYTAKYFPPESKAKVQELVGNLKAAYHARIERLDWMSPATKVEALKKLETYNVKVGYPDTPRDYTSLVVRDDDLVGNVRRAAAWDWAFFVHRLPGPVDRQEWRMTPQTNDAYNGPLRDIVFPAGILQPPIFDPSADAAINYGAVGGVIGHEMTHGFDDQGRKIDAEGRLRDWWTPKDAAIFEERAAKLGAQFDSYEPLPGVHVNGKLTMGENIADLGGLTLALDAYHASLHGKPAPVIDGLTGDRRVFLGWAQAWRTKRTDAALHQMVVSDPHSPPQYRVNGPVRNIDAWYESFGVKPGDKLYLAPEERVRIW
ncbi:MAG TPA: M13-type metalloendopeptidase [Acidobacteriaceae bacterium]|nr:M13-type metalloendopeptidase [Acidobacteriaceae bacterium]